MGPFVIFVILGIIIWVLASCIKIVPQSQAWVIERLGAWQDTWSVGMHIKFPFFVYLNELILSQKSFKCNKFYLRNTKAEYEKSYSAFC